MYRCLIWGYSTIFYSHYNLLRSYEEKEEIKIAAITGKEMGYATIDDIPFVSKSAIKVRDYDCVIIMSDKRAEIENEAMNLGFEENIIIGYKALEIWEFSFERFLALKKCMPSIIANNCWGGLTYNSIGERFKSPLINLFLTEEDYLKLLMCPRKYLEQTISFEYTKYSEITHREYPVCSCNDILIHFNHYDDFEHAKTCWDKRKNRINWDNLFVFFYTNNIKSAQIFDELSFPQKICFTSFDVKNEDLNFAIQVPFYNKGVFKGKELWESVNAMAKREIPFYDIIELLHHGSFKCIV